jgi:hypothetical protein
MTNRKDIKRKSTGPSIEASLHVNLQKPNNEMRRSRSQQDSLFLTHNAAKINSNKKDGVSGLISINSIKNWTIVFEIR